MSPAPPLSSWWTDHLQLPGYDPIATAGPARFDPRAAEQALGLCRKVGFWRPNPKIGYQKINDLRVSTFLFSYRLNNMGHS